MGADGHIGIYDYDKIVEELGEDKTTKLLDSTIYIQELNGKKYMTVYWSDNIYYNGLDWNDRMEGYEKSDWFIPKDEWKTMIEVVEKHRITKWEVWT